MVFLSLLEIGDQSNLKGPIEEVARLEAEEAEDLLKQLGIPVKSTNPPIYYFSLLFPALLYLSFLEYYNLGFFQVLPHVQMACDLLGLFMIASIIFQMYFPISPNDSLDLVTCFASLMVSFKLN